MESVRTQLSPIAQVHIVPWRSAWRTTTLAGSADVTFVLGASGHIAGVVNPPSLKKYQHWTGGKPVGDFEEWVAKATENPGSWWPHWHAWIEKQNNERVPARKVGGRKLKPLGDAPGDYVRVRV